MTIVFSEDGYIETLPLCDEFGYPLLTDGNGDEILDDYGEPIRTGFGFMPFIEDTPGPKEAE